MPCRKHHWIRCRWRRWGSATWIRWCCWYHTGHDVCENGVYAHIATIYLNGKIWLSTTGFGVAYFQTKPHGGFKEQKYGTLVKSAVLQAWSTSDTLHIEKLSQIPRQKETLILAGWRSSNCLSGSALWVIIGLVSIPIQNNTDISSVTKVLTND